MLVNTCLFHSRGIQCIELEQLHEGHSLAAMVRVVDFWRAHAVEGHEGCPPQLALVQDLHNTSGHSVVLYHYVEELVAACDLHCCVQIGLAAQELQQHAMDASVWHKPSCISMRAAWLIDQCVLSSLDLSCLIGSNALRRCTFQGHKQLQSRCWTNVKQCSGDLVTDSDHVNKYAPIFVVITLVVLWPNT